MWKSLVLGMLAACISGSVCAAEIVLTNCYEHWRKPGSNTIHVCILEPGQNMAEGVGRESDFAKVGERQFLICESEQCQLHIGVGYCEATVNNIRSAHYPQIAQGQYLIVTKRQQLELVEGNACR